jgi:hypothetical protein
MIDFVDIIFQAILDAPHFFHRSNILFAKFGESNGRDGTVKNRRTDSLLGFFDGQAEGGLGNKKLFCSPAEIPFLVDGVDIISVAKHGSPSLCISFMQLSLLYY